MVQFLSGKLGLTEETYVPISVTRVVEPRSKIESEVVAVFSSSHIRDAVKSSGFKLEGLRAGLRMEVPHFIKSDFQALQGISYHMKMANSGMKRSIKFDDEDLGLMLDVQIPGEDWRRIRPDQARAARRSEPHLRTGPVELSSQMIASSIRPPLGASLSSLTALALPSPTSSRSSSAHHNAAPSPSRSSTSSQANSSGANTTNPASLSGANTIPLGDRS